jgi:hypothetical protein
MRCGEATVKLSQLGAPSGRGGVPDRTEVVQPRDRPVGHSPRLGRQGHQDGHAAVRGAPTWSRLAAVPGHIASQARVTPPPAQGGAPARRRPQRDHARRFLRDWPSVSRQETFPRERLLTLLTSWSGPRGHQTPAGAALPGRSPWARRVAATGRCRGTGSPRGGRAMGGNPPPGAAGRGRCRTPRV